MSNSLPTKCLIFSKLEIVVGVVVVVVVVVQYTSSVTIKIYNFVILEISSGSFLPSYLPLLVGNYFQEENREKHCYTAKIILTYFFII